MQQRMLHMVTIYRKTFTELWSKLLIWHYISGLDIYNDAKREKAKCVMWSMGQWILSNWMTRKVIYRWIFNSKIIIDSSSFLLTGHVSFLTPQEEQRWFSSKVIYIHTHKKATKELVPYPSWHSTYSLISHWILLFLSLPSSL